MMAASLTRAICSSSGVLVRVGFAMLFRFMGSLRIGLFFFNAVFRFVIGQEGQQLNIGVFALRLFEEVFGRRLPFGFFDLEGLQAVYLEVLLPLRGSVVALWVPFFFGRLHWISKIVLYLLER